MLSFLLFGVSNAFKMFCGSFHLLVRAHLDILSASRLFLGQKVTASFERSATGMRDRVGSIGSVVVAACGRACCVVRVLRRCRARPKSCLISHLAVKLFACVRTMLLLFVKGVISYIE